MKVFAKKDKGKFKMETRITGGGPSPASPKALSLKIQELIPNEFEQLKNPYDNDSVVC